jgi:hypothetical protein
MLAPPCRIREFSRQTVQARRAKALTGFRFASLLHEKKETPGEAPGVEVALLTPSKNTTN